MSSLCFKDVVQQTKPEDTNYEFAGFVHAVLEYVFRLSCDVRGTVDCVVRYTTKIYDTGLLARIARVHVQKDGGRYFFYVFATAHDLALKEWRVIGRSQLLSAPIRAPNPDEMIWVE